MKFLPNLTSLAIIGCLTLSLKKEEVLVHQTKSQNVDSLARSIMVIVLFGRTIAFVVKRVTTRLGIAHIFCGLTKVSGNLKVVFLMLILQRRIYTSL